MPLTLLATALYGTTGASAAGVVTSTTELVFSAPITTTAPVQSLTVTNNDTAPATLQSASISGTSAGAFSVSGAASPQTIGAGQSATLAVSFAPTVAGTLSATLNVATSTGPVTVPLYGLAAKGVGGSNEPTLAQVLTTLGHPADVGGNTLSLPNGTAPNGEELAAPLFRRSGGAPVVLQAVARYAPDEALPFGWFTNAGSAVKHQVASMDAGQAQTLNPTTTGGTSFDPGTSTFGLYVTTAALGYDIYSEDALNLGPTAHAVRAYPLRDRAGNAVPKGYLVAMEDASGGDHQDYVFTITGVDRVVPSAVANVAFTTAGSTTVAGYTTDSGGAYDATAGRGWVSAATGAPLSMAGGTRLRTGPTDVRRRGLVIMQGTGTTSSPGPGAYELALPSGTYRVTASVGDNNAVDSTHSLTAEGSPLVTGFVPTSTRHFVNGVAEVAVTDGRLTIRATGPNTKINYLDVETVPAAAAADTTPPTVAVGVSGNGSDATGWAGSATVTVTSADETGVASTSYVLDGGQRTAYTGPFAVGGRGSHTVVARATDTSGNTTDSAPRSFTVTAGSGRLGVQGLDGAPFPDRLVMSRIQIPETGTNPKPTGGCCIPANSVHDTSTVRLSNTGSGPLTVSGLSVSAGFVLVTPPALPVTIAAGATADVTVRFTYAGATRVTVGGLTVTSDDPTTPSRVVELAGIWQKYSEMGVEATLADLVKGFGYTTTMVGAGQKLNGRGLVQTVGDEVLSPYWVRVDPTVPVSVRQLAAFHTQGNTATISYFPKATPSTVTGKLTHLGVDGQTVLPRIASATSPSQLATTTWSPTTSFGIRIDTETSVDTLNDATPDTTAGCPGPCGHHVRSYPAYDRAGVLMPNTWIVVMDYSGINYDYQDNMYLVTGMRPEVSSDDPSGTAVLPGAAGTSLDFAAPVTGTLPDATGQGTGFTQTQGNKNDTTPRSASLKSAQLSLGNGALAVTTTAGSNGGTDNTLANGLALPFDAGAEVTTVTSRLNGPFTAIDAGAEQAGVQFGPDQDDFAKVAVINSGGTRKVQLYGEVASVGTQAGLSAVVPATAQALDLYLVLDPAAGSVRGYYRVDAGPLVAVPGTVAVPAASAGRWFTRQGRAGIITTSKSGTAFTASFDSFAIRPGDESQPDGAAVRRIDSGSTTSYTDAQGNVWAPDTGLFTPSTTPAEGATTTPTAIDNTVEDPLYRTYRGNVGSLTPRTFSYAIPTADLAHARVRLLFTERASTNRAVGKRVFSITAEGTTYRLDMDIFASAGAGNSAVTLTLPTMAVSGGTLDLSFTASKDYPSVSGVELLDQDTPAPLPAPAPVSAVTASQSAAGPVTVSWSPSAGNGTTTVGYYVYRSTTLPVDTSGTPVSGSNRLSGTSFSDSTIAASTTYYYAVIASNDSANSAPTTSPAVTTRDTVPPGQVTGLTAIATQTSVALSWSAVPDSDVAGYRVYRSTTSPVPTSGAGLAGGLVTGTTFTDTTVVTGTSYAYVVLAEDAAGNRGIASAELRATAGDTTPPAAPTGALATVNTAGPSVTVTWNTSTETDLAGYAVYRGATASFDGMTALATGLTATSYSDTAVSAGTTYYYAVTASDTAGNRSAPSSSVQAVVPPVAQPVSLRVDFTTGSGRLATGYLRDSGQPYAKRTSSNQGSGLSYGWVVDGTGDPLDLRTNTRDVTSGTVTTDQRLLSFIHVQYPAETTGGVSTPGSWEVAVPNGAYTVSLGVGDPRAVYNSEHWASIEDQNAVAMFVPTSASREVVVTRTVNVADGKLTLSPAGGSNTKFDYVDIDSVPTSPARPSVAASAPANGATSVLTSASVTNELRLPAGGLQSGTVTPANVTLTRVEDGTGVPVNVNTSGGGDTIVLTPQAALGASTQYRFDVSANVLDAAGNPIQPWSSVFTTGNGTADLGLTGVAFTKSSTTGTGQDFTSVVVGPDHQLYAGTLEGNIYRYPIGADGDLGPGTVIDTVVRLNGGAMRTVIGMAFAPGSTAAAPELWVTDNAPYLGTDDVADWQGKIDRLTGVDLQNGVNVITGLPRSNRDHETNSLAFGPDGALYVTQGSNTAMGAPDPTWGNRQEHTLSGAVLRLDRSVLPSVLPLDVKTQDGGTYDPRPTTAPLRLYATGIRNAFDLVWHSNGSLYTPTNGSAAGGNTPTTPATLPAACQNRADGPYTGPAVTGLSNNTQAETDWVFNVHQGGYYGHPDAARCEYVMNGGNPTTGADQWEVRAYGTGTQPDRNYRAGDVYDAGLHASADGAIEYHGSAFGGALEGKLLVVRYSAGQDIMVLDPSGPGGAITARALGVTGFTGFNAPLDVAEDQATGTVYVTELGGQRITRLTPSTA